MAMPKILAIDDKRDNLVTISAILKNLMPDYHVLTASSGAEGIKKAKEEQPDVVLLDIKMPRMDGFEVCEKLKADESVKNIQIILITAVRTETTDRIKGLEIGADAFITKPIDEGELVAQLKVMLRIKKAEDALRKEMGELEEIVGERTRKFREERDRAQNYLDVAGVLIIVVGPDQKVDLLNKTGNGDEALEIGRLQSTIDLIITDVVMPGKSGPELVEMMQDFHPATRVLFISGYNEDFIMRRGAVDKEINFFHKPFTPGSLKQKVRELLDG